MGLKKIDIKKAVRLKRTAFFYSDFIKAGVMDKIHAKK